MKLLLSLPFQLLAVIVGVVIFGTMLPLSAVEFFYTISVCFKELLSQVLPFMVFFFVMSGILSFRKSAPIVLAILLVFIFFSNGIVATLSYGVMSLASKFISCGTAFIVNPIHKIEPWFTLSLPTLSSIKILGYIPFATFMLTTAILLGLIFSFFPVKAIENVVLSGKKLIQRILEYGFIPFLPLYVFGSLLKLRYEGMFSCLSEQYGSAFLLIIGFQTLYTVWIYFLSSGFSMRETWRTIKNAMPSYLTAFSTMSSVASVPAAIDAAEKNTGNRPLAEMTIPIMANMHMLGDSVSIPILTMFSMLLFQGMMPSPGAYVIFVVFFCAAMFGAAGAPGGGILVVMPILLSQFHFTSDMEFIMITLYLLLDPFGTAANVMGDGALTIIMHKVLKRLGISSAD